MEGLPKPLYTGAESELWSSSATILYIVFNFNSFCLLKLGGVYHIQDCNPVKSFLLSVHLSEGQAAFSTFF